MVKKVQEFQWKLKQLFMDTHIEDLSGNNCDIDTNNKGNHHGDTNADGAQG